MKSWPEVSIPPIDFTLPPLRLSCTQGEIMERSETFTSYVCGITPYDATHLGHAATYITFDLIHRYQTLRGQKVEFVENITDIDDPLLERANRDGQSWRDLASDQIDLFKEDMVALRVVPPKNYVPVTEVINQVVSAIEVIKGNGFTYEIAGDVYFRISPFLKNLPIGYEEALSIFAERGGDPDRVGKEEKLDPLLWQKNRDGEPGWKSTSLGFGRPGWHIECSVIAIAFLLGPNYLESKRLPKPLIDLQGGGSDLIFPHHFMSSSLAQALTNREFAAAFVHTGMVGLDGEKMSKSKGNLVFVSKLLSAGVDPMIIRFALLSSNYHEDRMWTQNLLESASLKVAKIRQALSTQNCAQTSIHIKKIAAALADNLDTVKALAILQDWADQTLSGSFGDQSDSPGEISRFIDSALGLAL